MIQRCKVEIKATIMGFYDPSKESLECAQERIVLEAEMAANKSGEIRMHSCWKAENG